MVLSHSAANSYLYPQQHEAAMTYEVSKWDQRWLKMAEFVATTFSKDPRTKVGCVIAKHKQFISFGYNGFPRGVEDTPERYADRDTKYKFVVHAEANALRHASSVPEGASLYVTLKPCSSCAKEIIQSGIRRVFFYEDARDPLELGWNDADIMFSEAGVDLLPLKRV